VPVTKRKKGPFLAAAAGSYLLIAIVLWWSAWGQGASTHTLCGCGDPALFLWFFQWPATAVAHFHNPFYSQALFHPGGINLLAQTSVMGLSVPLIPVTWIFGPVASLNVASTLCPALSALFCFLVLRRWVTYMPAAYIGGLLYGFSPFVLTSLQFAHLMTAAVMVLPLILAVLDEILIRQRHSPRVMGVVLGLLLFVQFFLSSELLALLVMVVAISVVVLAVAAWFGDRDRLRRAAPWAAEALVVGGVVGGILLVYPVWFALDGPAHLSGLVWPNIGAIGGYIGSSFVSPDFIHGSNVYTALGGYEGTALPSSAYLGWGMLVVLAAGTAMWFRERILWFFGFVLALCMVCSLGARKGQWEPARLFAHLPVIKNVIEQRFMAFGFLAAAVMLALIIERTRRRLPARLKLVGTEARVMGVGAALGVAGVALVPIVATFASSLPFTMRAVSLPRWYTTVAPKLPPGRVVLTYPTPFSGIQVSMAWQAVDAMSFSQAGGGGPQGVDFRAGAAKAGFSVLATLAFGVLTPQPDATARNLAAVRKAISVWKVNTVVIDPQGSAPVLLQGHDPVYAAGFMTAALGRLPSIEAGAWVWNNVSTSAGTPKALSISKYEFDLCVLGPGVGHSPRAATMGVARCIEKRADRGGNGAAGGGAQIPARP
jgi:dolichyl-phosphate beta-glucosyltransferase